MSQKQESNYLAPQLLEHLPYELDQGLAERAAIGLIVLATDYTIEHEWRRVVDRVDGVALYHSRIHNLDRISPESLGAMAGRITESAKLLTPDTPLDVVAYGCTSASTVIGEETVFDKIRAARPGVSCTTPITAAFAAFATFGARRVGVLTPYPADVNKVLAEYIAARGFEVPVFGSFNLDRDTLVSRISPSSVEQAIGELLKQNHCDAVFVSCTSVRLLDNCARLEERFGIPLTSSNHAMAWHALRLAGIDDRIQGLGSLFDLQLA